MIKNIFWGFAGLLFVLSACSYSTNTAEENESKENDNRIFVSRSQFESSGMELGKATSTLFEQHLRAQGYIKPSATGEAQISVSISGTIQKVHLSVGDYVSQGQELFQLQSTEFVTLQQEYTETASMLEALKADYERQEALAAENIRSQKDFMNAKSEYMRTLAKSEGLESRLKILGVNPEQVLSGNISSSLSIKAPMSGYVTERDITQGMFVEPQTHLITLINTDQLQLEILVFQKDVLLLEKGQKIQFNTPDHPELKFEAELEKIGKSIQTNTMAIPCIGKLNPEDKERFVSGMYMECLIQLDGANKLGLPTSAIVNSGDKDYILELTSEDEEGFTFRKMVVETGATYQGYTEIHSTISDSILVKGAFNLILE